MVKQNGKHIFQPNEPTQPSAPLLDAAKLALIASAVTTLGDILGTMAAALAVQEEANKSNEPSNTDIERQLKKMQKQLDYLTNQVSKK